MYAFSLKHSSPSATLKLLSDFEKQNENREALAFDFNRFPGHRKVISFKNEIECLCAKYTCHDDLKFKKTPIGSEFFTLRFNDIFYNALVNNDADIINTNKNLKTNFSVHLLNSLKEFNFFVPKNSIVRTLEIKFSSKFFFEKINISGYNNLVKEFLENNFKNNKVNYPDNQFKSLFYNILNGVNKKVTDLLFLEKSIGELITRFFSKISADLNNYFQSEKIKITSNDVTRLMEVRKFLDTETPPPCLHLLTKIAFMSGTSLKTKFKKMYGATLYEYFQRRRMQRARILLLTHKFSVKQVGIQLGYSNLSNFSIAFKKQFNHLPKELIKQ